MFSVRTLLTVVGAGNARARLRATRDGQAAVRLNVGAAALSTGVLDALSRGPTTPPELARRLGGADVSLVEAFLRVLDAAGWVRVRAREDGWPMGRRGATWWSRAR